jgi:hypothetical protein
LKSLKAVVVGAGRGTGETMSSYDKTSAVFNDGLSKGQKYVRDIGEKFGTFVPTPKNPHPRSTEENRAWAYGFAEAISDWFQE